MESDLPSLDLQMKVKIDQRKNNIQSYNQPSISKPVNLEHTIFLICKAKFKQTKINSRTLPKKLNSKFLPTYKPTRNEFSTE